MKLIRNIRFFWQRRIRGWDDSDTWDLGYQFGNWIVPRLKRFKELNNGYPDTLTSDEWDDIIQEMIDGFEVLADAEQYYNLTEKNAKKIQKSADLFYKWYQHLWW